ncbi:MAG TPA: helix-turn-helix domain-containing protein, partial [Desulfosporosinus sp.]|nr:helix-turn-helix domain-containing protein [Desulfosporosinus sp.]
SALKSLMNYNWPGNIREIQNLVERLVVLTTQVKIDEKSICEELETTSLTVDDEAAAGYQYGLKRAMDKFEMNLVRSAMKQHGGNLGEAAKGLKIHRTTLLRKLHRYNKLGSRANS